MWRILRILRWFRTEKDNVETDFQKEVESNEFTITTYGGGPKNGRNRMQIWKKELRNQIEFAWCFEELRGELGNSEEDKIWKAHEEQNGEKKLRWKYLQF